MTLGATPPLVALAKNTARLIKIPVRDQDGNAFDLTNGQAVFWVGKCPDSTDADVIIKKTTPASGATIALDGATGLWTVSVTIDPADTANEPSRASYYAECRVWDQFDNPYVVVAGAFEIDPSLTAPAAEPP